MDTKTGRIAAPERLIREFGSDSTHIRPIDIDNLSSRAREVLERTGTVVITRNSRCPCGSGKRFKRCCLDPR